MGSPRSALMRVPIPTWFNILELNDEHQGEGGTLVFIAANNTTCSFSLQEENR